MAGFRTHISTSTVVGIGYGAAGYLLFQLPWESCLIAGGLCSIAGMLPDLDSDSGIPVRETLGFVSVAVPILMIRRLTDLRLSHEQIVLIAAAVYAITRYGIGSWFRRYTVHRGMWHSIPAALIAGLLTFLLVASNELQIRLFKSWAVVIGYLTHLILDEIYSVDLKGVRIRLKKSSGTALKWWGSKTWGNCSVYAKLILLAVLVWFDPTVQTILNQPLDDSPAVAEEKSLLDRAIDGDLWRQPLPDN